MSSSDETVDVNEGGDQVEVVIVRQNSVPIQSNLKKHAINGTLTVDIIKESDATLTDILRLATHPKAKEFVLDNYGYRGLPLRKGFELFPHQIEALNFMREREQTPYYGIKGGIISLKMGLGKSLTAATHSLISPGGMYPTLIVCSLTMVPEWETQCFEKFFGEKIKVCYFHKNYLGDKRMKLFEPQDFSGFDFVITTYDVLKTAFRSDDRLSEDITTMGDEHTLMKGKVEYLSARTHAQCVRKFGSDVSGIVSLYYTPWKRVICDESQTFANPTTKCYSAVLGLYGDYKWCLTGTPIRNYDTDIFAQFRFLGYDAVKRTIDWRRSGDITNRSQKLSKTVILSMNFEQAGITLPPKHDRIIPVELDGNEKVIYDHVLGCARQQFNDYLQGYLSFSCILAIFTKLRQASIAPYLLMPSSKRNATTEEKSTDVLISKIVNKNSLDAWCLDKLGTAGIYSKKVSEIINIVNTKIPKGEKFIIFSTFTSALDLIGDAIKERIPHISFVQVDGDIVGNDRSQTLDAFRTSSSIDGLLVTYKCGSEGLNLTEARHVIFVEAWWSPAVLRQAEARVHRTGQKAEVNTWTINVTNSIEDHILAICKGKDDMAKCYLEEAERVVSKGIDKSTLAKILRSKY